jgi:RluA family pseudouridine synthase
VSKTIQSKAKEKLRGDSTPSAVTSNFDDNAAMIGISPLNMSCEVDFRPLGNGVRKLNEGQRLDVYLAQEFPFWSRSRWQNNIRAGMVLVDEKTAMRSSQAVHAGSRVKQIWDEAWEPKVEQPIKVIMNSPHIAVISKPSGMPMHENGPYFRNTVAQKILTILGQDWAPVHRIDRDTSGLVVCARGSELRSKLSYLFENHQVTKVYRLIIRGGVEQEQQVVQAPLGLPYKTAIRSFRWVESDGESAVTVFKKTAEYDGLTELTAQIQTGRTHQIRVHAAYTAAPIAGDVVYGCNSEIYFKWKDFGYCQDVVEATGARRLLLHAEKISFISPLDGGLIDVTHHPDQLFYDALYPKTAKLRHFDVSKSETTF